MEANEHNIEITFHDIDYIVSIKIHDDKFTLLLEERFSGNLWKSSCSAEYIENITAKAGNPKKFQVYTKLLISSLKKEDKSTYIDLLTYDDLAILKNKKAEEPKHTPTEQEISKKKNMRYLILTVCTQTERTHYPLFLNPEHNPDKETMRKTLQRLREELALTRKSSISSAVSLKANSFYSNESSHIEEENEKLKKKIALFELTRTGAVDLDSLSKSIHEKAKDIEKIKTEAEKEIVELKSKISEREKELEETKSELSKTKTEWNKSQTSEEYETLRKTLNDLSVELDNEKEAGQSIINKQKSDIEYCQREIRTAKESERKANVKIKQLENELDLSIKKLNISMYGTTKSSRNNSASSKKSSGYGKISPAPRHNTTTKRTTSLPSSQKKPAYSTSKKPQQKYTPSYKPPAKNSATKYSPANYNTNRRSPYNSRSGSKGKGTSAGKYNQPTRKFSPAQRPNPLNRNAKPANLQNRKQSPAPLKDNLHGKAVQLVNAAKKIAKSEVNKMEDSKQIVAKVEKEIALSNKLLSSEDVKLQKLNNEIDSINVNDIDQKLSKLQDLLKLAKS